MRVPELREVALGEYEGAAFEEARLGGDPLLAAVFEHERWDLLPGAEPTTQFARRVRLGLRAVLDSVSAGGHALVFTHGGVIAELCSQVTNSRAFAFIEVDNASLTTLMVSAEGRWTLRGFNDSAHLE